MNELDLDALEREAIERPDKWPLQAFALIQRLREWERISDEILSLFTMPDQFPALRQPAMTDAPFHAALRIIEIHAERLREEEAGKRELKAWADVAVDDLEARIAQLERALKTVQLRLSDWDEIGVGARLLLLRAASSALEPKP